MRSQKLPDNMLQRVLVQPARTKDYGLTNPSDEQWQELLGALFQCSQSTEAGQRETAFRIFATTPDIIEKQHEQAVIGAFTKGFKDSETTVG